MEYRPLGRTGVQVSKLCLGTMMFGAWGNTDHDDSIRIIHRALDAGINFVDTADVYSAGESEEIVGKALKGRRDDVVLATKFFMPMGEDPNRRGGSRRWIIQAVEDSLRRLGTDWIDLYQVHRPDPDIDVEETLGALTDLVQQGKVRYIGSSSYSAGADRRGAVDRARARPGALPHRAAALLAARPRHRARRPARPRSATAWASSPTARWPAAGCRAAGAPTARRPRPARQRLAARFDMSLPENQRKLEAVEQLAAGRRRRRRVDDRAGDRLRRQPPGRHLGDHRPADDGAARQPAARRRRRARRRRSLDRIDEIVQPGVNLNPADTSYGEQVLEPALRRR